MAKLTGWEKDTSPFHKGEQELQARLGLAERQEKMARIMMRPFMPDQHREFFGGLPFMIIGNIDDQDNPWASVVFGREGFIQTPTDRQMRIEAAAVMGDPLAGNIGPQRPVSLLGIEPATRRRNRMNGVTAASDDPAIMIDVVQSFGNCPKYIQTRQMHFARDPRAKLQTAIDPFTDISEDLKTFIRKADTFFVASYNPHDDIYDTGGVDINHRGGKPGFVHIDGNVLTIPDYAGNNLFNSLGNFLVHPKGGLLFIDFETGDIIQMSGHVKLHWDMNDKLELATMPGAQRAWSFTLEHGHVLRNACPLRGKFGEYSPYLPD